MVENIQPDKGTFGGRFIDDVTIIKDREPGRLQTVFGRESERGLILVEEPQPGLKFVLMAINVKLWRKSEVQTETQVFV